MNPSESTLRVTEHVTQSGQRFGQLTLNKPRSLNALDLNMATAMLRQLQAWQSNDDILFVVINGAGEKAFCAGGDIVSMYQAITAQTQADIPPFIKNFFTVEYTLDFTIHQYSKPIVVWGEGIVMGGGMGLLQGASHRVVTCNSRLAMPEITIGLFPDVGGSYFLPRLANHLGLFLGLTAAQLNGTESVNYGLADHLCPSGALPDVIANWQSMSWHAYCEEKTAEALTKSLIQCAPSSPPADRMAAWQDDIEQIACQESVADVVNGILALNNMGDGWMAKAQATLSAGSALSAAVFFNQFRRGQHMALADCFRMELIMACRSAMFGELQEGIRALLIDKDGKPAWRYKQVKDIPKDIISLFFTPPWEGAHPLAHLGG